MLSQSDLRIGDQTGTANSKRGRINVLFFFLQKNSVRDFLIEFLSAGNLNQATNATKQNTNTNYYDERQYY
jgi:hypothetical protein